MPQSHLEDKRNSTEKQDWTPAQKIFANCPKGTIKGAIFWTEVQQSLPTQLWDFLNDVCSKIASYVEIYNFVMHCGYPMDLLRDISIETPLDVMI